MYVGNLNSVFLECSLVSASCAMFLATLPQAGNEGKRSTLRSAFKRRGKKRKKKEEKKEKLNTITGIRECSRK